MDNIKIVKENSEIFKNKSYTAKSGTLVDISKQLEFSNVNTKFYPHTFEVPHVIVGATKHNITVTEETTNQAIHRLRTKYPNVNVLALNFASAKEPGGGYLRGAIAQEEDICRGSSLYNNLLTQPDYYRNNKNLRSPLYTDGMIISKEILFFRDQNMDLLEVPITADVLTCPAPMAKICSGSQLLELESTLDQRIHKMLHLAYEQGYHSLILGAWGCGAFGNDPILVSSLFNKHLKKFKFVDVCFAIYDKANNQKVLKAFRNEL